MKKLCVLSLLLTITTFSFGQKTFTSRIEASTWLKETFSKCFVKTGYSTFQGSAHYYYDYILYDNYIIIKVKEISKQANGNEKQKLTWYSTNYRYPITLSQTTAFAEYPSFIQLKSGEIYGGDREFLIHYSPFAAKEWKAFDFYFPFDLTKEKNTIETMQSAFDYIKFCDEREEKRYSDSVAQAKKENAGKKDNSNNTNSTIYSLWHELDSALIAMENRKIVFEENFSNNQNKWFEEETDRYNFKLLKGINLQSPHYRIESKKGGFWLSSIPIQFSTSDNFRIYAVFNKVSGTDDYYFGMLLGKNRNTGYYHFAGITGSGNGVFANKGSTPKDLILSTDNKNIKKGNALNSIEIVKEGNVVQLLINGYDAGKTSYEKFYGNDFGFQLWSGDQNLMIDVYGLTIWVTKAGE